MKLNIAHLSYGSTLYAVKPTEHLPLPTTFDFDNAEECARKVFAVMSNASGGHVLTDCKVRIHKERQIANLTAHGAHVYYRPDGQPKLSVEEAFELHSQSTIIELGTVVTDQYGDGWKRARWS